MAKNKSKKVTIIWNAGTDAYHVTVASQPGRELVLTISELVELAAECQRELDEAAA